MSDNADDDKIEYAWTYPPFVTVIYEDGDEEVMSFEESNLRFRVVTASDVSG